MNMKPSDPKREDKSPLKNWEAISGYYYDELPKFKDRQDEDQGGDGEGPRWLFRGDSPCPDQWKGDDGAEGPGPLMPKDYDVLKEAFKSRLDRAFEEFEITARKRRLQIEWGLMRTFRRRAHLHTGSRGDDWLERLGLMAHYEAPQRMLDWTYSFFNALYFAINGSHSKGDCIVWALNKSWLRSQADLYEERILTRMESTLSRDKFQRMKDLHISGSPRFDSKIVHFLMLTNDTFGIYPVTPYHQNERLSIQQGTLICPGTINCTWGENLKGILPKEDKDALNSKWGPPLVKIPISLCTKQRNEVLRQLHAMNINQATLFPDLDGFARSLRLRLADPETIVPAIPPIDSLEI